MTLQKTCARPSVQRGLTFTADFSSILLLTIRLDIQRLGGWAFTPQLEMESDYGETLVASYSQPKLVIYRK